MHPACIRHTYIAKPNIVGEGQTLFNDPFCHSSLMHQSVRYSEPYIKRNFHLHEIAIKSTSAKKTCRIHAAK